MIVACSATASRRTLSGGSATFAASMTALETRNESCREQQAAQPCLWPPPSGDERGEGLGEVAVAVAGHQLLLPRHPDADGAGLCNPGQVSPKGAMAGERVGPRLSLLPPASDLRASLIMSSGSSSIGRWVRLPRVSGRDRKSSARGLR